MGQASQQRARPHQIDFTIKRYVEWYESVRARSLSARSRRKNRESVGMVGS